MSRDLHVPNAVRTHQWKNVRLHVATGVGVFVADLGRNHDQILQRTRRCDLGHNLAVWYGYAKMPSSFLFGVKPLDPLTLLAAFSILAAVALVAAFVPAWRAVRIDPITALRAE